MTYVGLVYRPIPNINNGINNGIKYHTNLASNVQIFPLYHYTALSNSKKNVEYHTKVVLKNLLPLFMFIFPLVSILDHHLVYIHKYLQSLWTIW